MKDRRRRIGFTFAWEGLKEIYKSEWNFRIHLAFAFAVFVLSFILGLSRYEWIIVIFAIGFVLVVEIINSVIERMIDYLKPEHHPAAKIIKDAAAGAVFVSALVASIIGVIIFLPKLYSLVSSVLQ